MKNRQVIIMSLALIFCVGCSAPPVTEDNVVLSTSMHEDVASARFFKPLVGQKGSIKRVEINRINKNSQKLFLNQNMIGVKIENAEVQFRPFTLKVTESYNEFMSAGVILDQMPKDGHLPEGYPIKIRVSKGTEPKGIQESNQE